MKAVNKFNDWININQAISMGIGYQYNTSISVYFNVPYLIDVFGRTHYKRKKVKLINPILRPFRNNDGVLEFGIHDKGETGFESSVPHFRVIESVIPFFRFLETELEKDTRFTKVKSTPLQKHEKMILKGVEKATKMQRKMLLHVCETIFKNK